DGERREAEPAVLLRDDHREEALLEQVVPGLPRHIAELVGDLPVVEHPAQRLRRAVEESLLLVAEARRRKAAQLAPIRIAGEQLPFPPYVAGLERLLLGPR